jgi:hypothetical protein
MTWSFSVPIRRDGVAMIIAAGASWNGRSGSTTWVQLSRVSPAKPRPPQHAFRHARPPKFLGLVSTYASTRIASERYQGRESRGGDPASFRPLDGNMSRISMRFAFRISATCKPGPGSRNRQKAPGPGGRAVFAPAGAREARPMLLHEEFTNISHITNGVNVAYYVRVADDVLQPRSHPWLDTAAPLP